MSIGPNELRRLHEAATPGPWHVDKLGYILSEFNTHVIYGEENTDLLLYLRNHVPDILAALEVVHEAANHMYDKQDMIRVRELAARAAK